jgi:hypothetical protein
MCSNTNNISINTKTASISTFLKSKWILAVLLFFPCTVWSDRTVSANSMSEYKVKAAFVLNFALLTEWPEQSFSNETAPIKLCVLGDRRLMQAFDSINGKKIGKRSLQVTTTPPHDASPSCHIIFIGKNVSTKIVLRTLTNVSKKPVLTIGEKDTFIDLGGAIHFFMEKSRLRFGVNTTVIEKQNLRLSSRLLKIARLTSN